MCTCDFFFLRYILLFTRKFFKWTSSHFGFSVIVANTDRLLTVKEWDPCGFFLCVCVVRYWLTFLQEIWLIVLCICFLKYKKSANCNAKKDGRDRLGMLALKNSGLRNSIMIMGTRGICWLNDYHFCRLLMRLLNSCSCSSFPPCKIRGNGWAQGLGTGWGRHLLTHRAWKPKEIDLQEEEIDKQLRKSWVVAEKDWKDPKHCYMELPCLLESIFLCIIRWVYFAVEMVS